LAVLVELGAHHDDGAGAVVIDGDDAGLADVLGDLEAQAAHLAGQGGGRALLLEGQLRVAVDVLVQGLEVRVVARHLRLDRRLGGRNVEGLGRSAETRVETRRAEHEAERPRHPISHRHTRLSLRTAPASACDFSSRLMRRRSRKT
jgi:hypothetical protein